jgi:hypothetical protein
MGESTSIFGMPDTHCNSVEIINTTTLVSRNNQKFEVYQYKKEESPRKEIRPG